MWLQNFSHPKSLTHHLFLSGSENMLNKQCLHNTVPFRPGVQSLVTSDLELNTRYVLSRVTRPIEQRAKEIAEICQKYLL